MVQSERQILLNQRKTLRSLLKFGPKLSTIFWVTIKPYTWLIQIKLLAWFKMQ